MDGMPLLRHEADVSNVSLAYDNLYSALFGSAPLREGKHLHALEAKLLGGLVLVHQTIAGLLVPTSTNGGKDLDELQMAIAARERPA